MICSFEKKSMEFQLIFLTYHQNTLTIKDKFFLKVSENYKCVFGKGTKNLISKFHHCDLAISGIFHSIIIEGHN